MAYTQSNYLIINPREEFLPYDLLLEKDLEEARKKSEEFLNWYYSGEELLKRDSAHLDKVAALEDKKNRLVEALNKGDLASIRAITREGSLLNDQAVLNRDLVKAKLKSNFILSLRLEGDKYAYSKKFDENTPLDEIDEYTSYQRIPLADYVTLGALLGALINSEKRPEVVDYILNNTLALISQGASLDDVKDAWDNDPNIKSYVDSLIEKSGVDTNEKSKLRNSIYEGLMSLIKRTITMQQNLDVTKRISSRGSGTRGNSGGITAKNIKNINAAAKALREQELRILNNKYNALPDESKKQHPWYTKKYPEDKNSNDLIKHIWEWNRSTGEWEEKTSDIKADSNQKRDALLAERKQDKPTCVAPVTDKDRQDDIELYGGYASTEEVVYSNDD